MRKLLSCVVLAFAAAASRGETVQSDAVALGWQTEHAAEVCVGTVESDTERGASGAREVTIRVDEAVRGPLAAGAVATVVSPDHGHGRPWVVGTRCLAFLDDMPVAAGEAPRFRLVSGSFGIRTIEGTGPESRFPDVVRKVAATLDANGHVAHSSALRTLLVGWIEDADPGIAWSAATDLVRHADLHASLTDDERERIVAAYRRCPIGKATKAALAFAVAATKHPSAAAALVETLQLPDAKFVRGAVAEALRRLHDASSEGLLDRALTTADAPAQKSLLVAIGFVGTGESIPSVRRSLAADDAAVRVEAAHALGLIARNLRETDPAARIEGRDDLAHTVATAKTHDEARAALWALAQLDDREAWKILRATVADETATELVRKTAAQYLKQPRVSLLLE